MSAEILPVPQGDPAHLEAPRLSLVPPYDGPDEPFEPPPRPITRADCVDGPRPCPWVTCRWHLYLDVNENTGSVKINFPDIEPWDLEHSCALDVADSGEKTLEEVGDLTNLTRERIRQSSERLEPRLRRAYLRAGMGPGPA